jgi:hypothetical protein
MVRKMTKRQDQCGYLGSPSCSFTSFSDSFSLFSSTVPSSSSFSFLLLLLALLVFRKPSWFPASGPLDLGSAVRQLHQNIFSWLWINHSYRHRHRGRCRRHRHSGILYLSPVLEHSVTRTGSPYSVTRLVLASEFLFIPVPDWLDNGQSDIPAIKTAVVGGGGRDTQCTSKLQVVESETPYTSIYKCWWWWFVLAIWYWKIICKNAGMRECRRKVSPASAFCH